MVIRSTGERAAEAPLNQNMESKKYIVVKNHVREIVKKDIVTNVEEIDSEKSKKKNKKLKKQRQSISSDDVNPDEISKSDIEELKSVYKKCKDFLTHFENKYGHLLDIDSATEHSKRKRENSSSDECSCTINRKIVFNDDGQQIYQDANIGNHICPKKLRKDKKYFPEKYQSIEIEDDHSNSLPESIQELAEVLKNPLLKSSLRNAVIDKIKSIKQDSLNMLRFDRNMLIQQLKANPDDIIDFKGTNISSLSGYPTECSKSDMNVE